LSFLVNLEAIKMLLLAYSILMLPFVVIGFLVVYLFLSNPASNHKLYFFDLVGAGLGAFLFYPLINSFDVFRSILLLALVTLACAIFFIAGKKWQIPAVILLIAFSGLALTQIPEPTNYKIDKAKGWEWIPGYFPE